MARKDHDPGPEAGNPRWAWVPNRVGEMIWVYYTMPDGSGLIIRTLFTKNNGVMWNHPGDINFWDGNIERPTLKRSSGNYSISLSIDEESVWHGFMVDGVLVAG